MKNNLIGGEGVEDKYRQSQDKDLVRGRDGLVRSAIVRTKF